ncbi:Terminal uridylyltransferase 4 [Bulinus truncatus]|nr:Terminal uridylyltransferase 4 [Bulinus truncatus]
MEIEDKMTIDPLVMAKGFNSHQATQDLRLLLKLNDLSIKDDIDKDASNMLMNSNGNALLNANIDSKQPKPILPRPHIREVPLPKQKNKLASNQNTSLESISQQRKQPSLNESSKNNPTEPTFNPKMLPKDTDLIEIPFEINNDDEQSVDITSSETNLKNLDSLVTNENLGSTCLDKKKELDVIPDKVSSASTNRNNKVDGHGANVRKGDKFENNNINNNKPRQPKNGEEEWSSEFLHTIEQNKIHVLKKVSAMDTVLRSIPQPTSSQLKALTDVVENVYQQYGISETEKKSRLEVVKRLEKIVQEKYPGVFLYMYGSSLTGFGLKTADINVDLNSSDKNMKLTVLLNEIYLMLKDKTETGFSKVKTDFLAKVPVLLLTDDATGFQVTIAIHCYCAHCSGELLSIYSDFDIRVRKLAVAFRYWAHLCGLDRHYEGFIPPQALNIMVIYYLQNCDPQIIPIITPPKVTGEEVGDFRKDSNAFEKMRRKVMKCQLQKKNDLSLGSLWLGLTRFYSLEFDVVGKVVSIRNDPNLSRTMKPWNSRKLSVEDPYMTKKNITRMVNNARIFEYWQDSIKKSYYYFGLPRNSEGKSLISDEELRVLRKKVESNDKPEEGKSISENQNKTAPSENQNKTVPVSHGSKDQSDEDKSVIIPPNPLIAKYALQEANKNGEASFQSPEVNSLPGKESHFSQITHNTSDSSTVDADQGLTSDALTPEYGKQSAEEIKSSDDSHANASSASSKCDLEASKVSGSESLANGPAESLDRWKDSQLLYAFTQEYFLTDGKGPTLVCTYCEQEGHLKKDCPEDELPEILPLPPLTPLHIRVLSETLNQVPYEVGLNDESFRERLQFLNNLQTFVKECYENAQLVLFGSSCNGFGFYRSDMDICMTFSDKIFPKLDKTKIIEQLAKKLKQHPDLMGVQAITTAKVPIVKFTVKKSNLEGDISLYNTLVCDIGDASRGSLSSYAYILMMLYYLQQVKPPVIPVLQELYVGKRPTLVIEGSEAWFMDDSSQLNKLWPHKGENKLSVAELWLGFLRFYVEDFQYKKLVISIRQLAPLTRFEKLWNGACLAIEDPFDLNHNLGSGLTRKMTNFIFKTFINARMLYGSPIDDNMEIFDKYQNPSDYFFDTDLLSESRPPNVRGCRKCGRIGHLVRHCPDRSRFDDQKKQQPPNSNKPQQYQSTPYKPLQTGNQSATAQKQSFQKSQQQQQQSHKDLEKCLLGVVLVAAVVRWISCFLIRTHSSLSQGRASPNTSRNQSSQKGQSGAGQGRSSPNLSRNQSSQKVQSSSGQGRSSPNLNRNQTSQKQVASGGPLSVNLAKNPLLQQVTPAQLRTYQQGQVFHNTQYQQSVMQQQQYQQHNQQQLQHHHFTQPQAQPNPHHHPQQQQMQQQQHLQHQQQQHNKPGLLPAHPGLLPQPLMSTPSRPGMNVPSNYMYGQPNILYGQPLIPFNGHMNNNQGMTQLARTQYSLNPIVQNLFASAHNQILDASSNQPQRRKQ